MFYMHKLKDTIVVRYRIYWRNECKKKILSA